MQHGQVGSHGGQGSNAAIARGATSREETEAATDGDHRISVGKMPRFPTGRGRQDAAAIFPNRRSIAGSSRSHLAAQEVAWGCRSHEAADGRTNFYRTKTCPSFSLFISCGRLHSLVPSTSWAREWRPGTKEATSTDGRPSSLRSAASSLRHGKPLSRSVFCPLLHVSVLKITPPVFFPRVYRRACGFGVVGALSLVVPVLITNHADAVTVVISIHRKIPLPRFQNRSICLMTC